MKLHPLSFLFAASFLALSGLAGCAADASGDTSGADDPEEVVEAEDALSAGPSNYGYYLVTRRDYRRCVSPICGGFFVKRVNAATTACADGSKQAECYVSDITYAGIGLSPREEAHLSSAVEGGKALLKARLYRKKFNGTKYGTLKASEGWLGATGSAPEGTFYRAADNGIRCIMAPCPSTTVAELNGRTKYNVDSVNLTGTVTPADQATLDRASQALATKDGILIAGGVATPRCLPASHCGGPLATASELYLRVTPREGEACGSRGLSACNADQFCNWPASAMCGAADAPGVCAYKPELCNRMFQPVCACNGQTYSNDCSAAAAGVSVASQGACPAPVE